MSQKTTAALLTEFATEFAKTNPESITPSTLGAIMVDLLDSFWNKTDTAFTLPPTEMTKAALATAIGTNALNDKQWIKITNRGDTFPLFVQAQGINTISPDGIWIVSGKPCAVVMDYVNGYEGETKPFIQVLDKDRKFWLNYPDPTNYDQKGISQILQKSATINFPSIAALEQYDATITVKGASVNDVVTLGVPAACMPTDTTHVINFIAWVSATDTVKVRCINGSNSFAVDPASATFTVQIFK